MKYMYFMKSMLLKSIKIDAVLQGYYNNNLQH